MQTAKVKNRYRLEICYLTFGSRKNLVNSVRPSPNNFIKLERRQNTKYFSDRCYRSTESLVSVQSMLTHQRSLPLYTLNKCRRPGPLRTNPICRSGKHFNWVIGKSATKLSSSGFGINVSVVICVCVFYVCVSVYVCGHARVSVCVYTCMRSCM